MRNRASGTSLGTVLARSKKNLSVSQLALIGLLAFSGLARAEPQVTELKVVDL
jgi:hypothetical protein